MERPIKDRFHKKHRFINHSIQSHCLNNPVTPEIFNSRPKYIERLFLGLLFLSIVTYFCSVLLSLDTLVEFDAYYHIQFAKQLSIYDHDLKLPQLEYTTCKYSYPDHQWLYHVLLKWLTFWDTVFVYNLSVVMINALVLFVFYVILSVGGIPNKLFWMNLLLISSACFLFRHSLVRAQSLSLLFLLTSVFFILKNYKFALALLSFLFVWVYSAFVYLPLIALMFILSEHIATKKINFVTFYCTLIGIVLGSILHPLFPRNISFAWQSIVERFIIQENIPIGSEWYPFNPLSLLLDIFPLLTIILLSVWLCNKVKPSLSKTTIFFLLLFTFFSITLSKSARFIEYMPPFALLFCGSLYKDIINSPQKTKIQLFWNTFNKNRWILYPILVVVSFIQLHRWNEMINSWNFPFERYRQASLWLRIQTNENEVIYNVSWSDFPQLYFYNTWNHYVCGLDPTFMNKYNSELAACYNKINRGEYWLPSQPIQEKFKIRLALVPKKIKPYYDFTPFIEKADKDPNMKRVYEDRYTIIYEIANRPF